MQIASRKTKILAFLSSIAPGLFLLGYNIGTGSVTTMAVSGAKYGMQLSWALLLSCVFTYFLIIVFGKYSIVTGNTALFSFKKFFGKPVAIFILVSLLFSELASCAGVMGVVTQVIQEWSRPMTPSGNGIPPLASAIFFGGILFFLIWNGKYSFFEKVLAVFVGLMALCFVMTLFITSPDPVEYIKGLVPSLPDEKNAFLIVSGMVGTTMGGILYVVRSILVSEKNWKIKDLKLEKRDAAISAIMMFVLSLAVMACASGTLKPKGLEVNNAIDMVLLMEPIAGKFAASMFVFGIVSAGISSLFPILLLAPWLLADYQGNPRNLKSPSSRALVLIGILVSFTVPVFGGRPVFVMIASQSLTVIATPIVLILITILMNKKNLLGKYSFTLPQNLLIGTIILFTSFIAIMGIIGLTGEV